MVVLTGTILVLSLVFGAWVLILSGRTPEAAGVGLIAGAAIAWAAWKLQRAISQSHWQYCALHETSQRSEQGAIDMLGNIIDCVEGRDRYWKGHSDSVGRLAEQMARKLNQPDQWCRMLGLAGKLHDVGKLGLPQIAQDRRFGQEEFRLIAHHSQLSHDMLEPLESLQPVLPAIRHHHERANGTGYPDELAGENVPLGARILAVADAYDAMIHDRPHRPAMMPHQAVAELERCTPAGYDSRCVTALMGVLNLVKIDLPVQGPAPALQNVAV